MRRLIAVIAAIAVGASLIGAVTASSATRVKVTEREYKIKANRGKAPAGKIRFVVTNKGDLEHELEVVRWAKKPGKIPVKNHKASFNEKREVGEVEDIEPGQTKRFTVRLKRGKYVLLCNIPGHYELGQYRRFRVTR